MIASRSFCCISPCMLFCKINLGTGICRASPYLATVKFASLILFVSQSTFFLVLQKMTACVMVSVS